MIFALVHYISNNKDQLLAGAMKLREEGIASGRNLSESECLEGVMSRYGENPGRVEAIRQRLWLSGCLETSETEAQFCRAVPNGGEIAASVAWRLQICNSFGYDGDAACANMVAAVQNHCDNAKEQMADREP